MEEQHLDEQQLGQRWHRSGSTLRRWRNQGIGPIYLKVGGKALYRLSDVEAYEANCLRKGTSERLPQAGAA